MELLRRVVEMGNLQIGAGTADRALGVLDL
jgi:hypothetical protein